jgi:hypothetical protein
MISTALYRLACLVFGSDLGIGWSVRPLGPVTTRIDAPRALVYDLMAGPYLGRTPRALASKLRVLERRDDAVLAEHYTAAGRIVATTLEKVRFSPHDLVEFELVRGPVPYVVERFRLRSTEQGTELEYSGELGTDLWAVGKLWGAAVARRWEAAVRDSLQAVKGEAERRATGG